MSLPANCAEKMTPTSAHERLYINMTSGRLGPIIAVAVPTVNMPQKPGKPAGHFGRDERIAKFITFFLRCEYLANRLRYVHSLTDALEFHIGNMANTITFGRSSLFAGEMEAPKV